MTEDNVLPRNPDVRLHNRITMTLKIFPASFNLHSYRTRTQCTPPFRAIWKGTKQVQWQSYRPDNRGSILGWEMASAVSRNCPGRLWSPPSLNVQGVPRVLSPGIKQPDVEDNQSFPSIAGVTNACGYTQYPPPYLHGACKDNSIFTKQLTVIAFRTLTADKTIISVFIAFRWGDTDASE